MYHSLIMFVIFLILWLLWILYWISQRIQHTPISKVIFVSPTLLICISNNVENVDQVYFKYKDSHSMFSYVCVLWMNGCVWWKRMLVSMFHVSYSPKACALSPVKSKTLQVHGNSPFCAPLITWKLRSLCMCNALCFWIPAYLCFFKNNCMAQT